MSEIAIEVLDERPRGGEVWISSMVKSGVIPRYVGSLMVVKAKNLLPDAIRTHVDGEPAVRTPLVDIGYTDMGQFEDTILEAMGYSEEDLPGAQ
jgi:hypothetical protein